MDTKKLRQKILDLAIHGKLVPQDPNDEPASVLLQRIREEKERLIKEGKIKRSKKAKNSSDTPPYGNDVPFDVPQGWEWTTVGDVCDSCLGKMLDKVKNTGEPLPYLRNANVRWGSFNISDMLSMPFEEDEIQRYSIKKGDIVVCEGGEPGRCAIWESETTVMFQKALHRLRCFSGISQKYLTYILHLYSSKNILDEYFTGSTIKHLTGNALDSVVYPLPPLAEQQRIVKEVERWFALIDKIEQGKDDLQAAVKQAKSKILDLVIHGKLVPQCADDEPASELLRRINPAAVACDKGPYKDLPKSWCFVRLGDISDYGKCINVGVEDFNDSEWTLELEDIEKDTAAVIHRHTKQTRIIKGVRHRFQKGDVLYSKLRTYLNKVLVAPEDGYCTTEIVPLKPFGTISSEYICSVLRSPFFLSYTAQCGYGVKMPRLSTTDARRGIVPLPPLAEQHRIVAKIEELFSQLDHIQSSLEA